LIDRRIASGDNFGEQPPGFVRAWSIVIPLRLIIGIV
jgi:hypothetical protein